MVILGRGLDGLNLGTNSLIVGVGGLLDELPIGVIGQVLTVNPSGDVAWVNAAVNGLQNIVEDLTPELGAQLDALTFKIVNLGDPTANQDAATKIYVDNAITILGASTPTGLNDLSDVDTTGLITGDVLVYNGISGNWEPQINAGGGLQNIVEDLTPQLGGTLDAQGAFKISNLLDPTLNQDAATKIYVDTTITDLINSAPGTLDTLNELAAALGNDPNFATTMTTLIGEKVAKAGDTMTGALVLSGNPTLALHAASKQYVDSVAGEVNTMANIVGGVGVYKQKVGVNFEMHPITGTGGTTVSLVGDVITVNSTSGTVTQIDTGDGISGGPITGTGTVSLDINGLLVAGAVDKANDTIAIYDASAVGVRKVTLSSLGVGDLVAVNNLSELTATQTTARANIGAAGALDLSNHVGDTTNPHSVTAAQVGAVAKIGDSMTGPLVFNAGASLTSATGVDLNIVAFTGQKTNIEGNLVEIQGANGTGGQVLLNADGSMQLRPATGFNLTLGDNIIMPFSIGTVGQIMQVNALGTALEFATNTGAGVSTLVALTDTTITAPLSGNVLRHDGTDWKNTILGYTDLSGLPILGTAAATAITDYATSTQGTLADSALQNIVEDLSPQLGANLDVQGFNIGTSDLSGNVVINVTNSLIINGTGSNAVIAADNALVASNAAGDNITIKSGSGDGIGNGGNILLTPGTAPGAGSNGRVIIDGLFWPSVDGTVGQVLITDGVGNLSFSSVGGGSTQNLWETITADTGSTVANIITDNLTISGGTDITTSIVGDVLTVAYSGFAEINQNAWSAFLLTGNTGGDTTVSSSTKTDTLTFVGGANITLTGNDITDTITIDASGGAFTQNIWETIKADDLSTTLANTSTDILTIAGGIGVSTSIVGDTLTITNTSPNVDQNLWNTIISDSGSVAANIVSDSLTVSGGTSISTSILGDTLTITNNAPNVDQNLWLNFNSDFGSIAANTTADTFSVIGGAGITTAIVGDILTITNTAPDTIQNIWTTITGDTGLTTSNTVADVLTIAGGAGITTAVVGDTLTITSSATSPNLWATFSTDDLNSTTANTTADVLTVSGGVGITTAIALDTLTITNNAPNIDQNIWATINADGATSTTANTTLDALTITGGAGITTSIALDTLTITNNAPNVDQNIWATINADGATSTTANTISDVLTVTGGAGITTAIVGDVLTISAAGGATQNLWETIAADTGSTVANLATDTLSIVGGTNVTTSIVGDVLTITAVTGAAQNVFTTFTGDTGTTTANLPTDTLNIVGGTNVTTALVGDTLTINSTAAAVVGAREERFRLNYATNGNLFTIDSASVGINTTTIISTTGGDVEIDFTGHAYPPSSIIIYGYTHTSNEYVMKFPDATFASRKIAGGGISGTPTAFGSFTTKMTITLREADTGASRGFGTTTHAWISFVFGD